jgi:16S rRNA processing protein RimM
VIVRPPHIAVARVQRVHGLRGEVRLAPYGALDGLRPGSEAVVTLADGRERRLVVDGARRHPAGRLVKFRGIDDAGAAGALVGADVGLPRAAAPDLPADTYYHYDILGLRVVTTDGEELGAVAEVWPAPGNDVYVVRGPRGEWLMPAAKALVAAVDLAGGCLVVRWLEGLIDPETV